MSRRANAGRTADAVNPAANDIWARYYRSPLLALFSSFTRVADRCDTRNRSRPVVSPGFPLAQHGRGLELARKTGFERLPQAVRRDVVRPRHVRQHPASPRLAIQEQVLMLVGCGRQAREDEIPIQHRPLLEMHQKMHRFGAHVQPTRRHVDFEIHRVFPGRLVLINGAPNVGHDAQVRFRIPKPSRRLRAERDPAVCRPATRPLREAGSDPRSPGRACGCDVLDRCDRIQGPPRGNETGGNPERSEGHQHLVLHGRQHALAVAESSDGREASTRLGSACSSSGLSWLSRTQLRSASPWSESTTMIALSKAPFS